MERKPYVAAGKEVVPWGSHGGSGHGDNADDGELHFGVGLKEAGFGVWF